MADVLVIAETRRGTLSDISLEMVAAGLHLRDVQGGSLTVAVLDPDPGPHAVTLSRSGADEVLTVTTPVTHFEPHVAERAAAALIDAVAPKVVILGHTVDSLGFAPALAARGGHGFASDITAIDWIDGLHASRYMYGGKLVVDLEFPDRSCIVLLVRAGAFPAATQEGSEAPVRALEAELHGAAKTEHIRFEEAPSDGTDITSADFLLSVGRGAESEDDLRRFEQLADRLGATLSVSRPLVDAGWAPSSRQVGQSGKTVKPRVYLAFGISGAVQHLAGIRGAGTVIAVNSDPRAPIFSVADYGAIVDMFDLADALELAYGKG